MKQRIKRIAPVQLGKMLAVIYALLSLIFVPFILMFGAIASTMPKTPGAPPFPAMLGLGMGFMIFMPVIYAIMGFIGGALGALIYNLVAKWLGGIEVEMETE